MHVQDHERTSKQNSKSTRTSECTESDKEVKARAHTFVSNKVLAFASDTVGRGCSSPALRSGYNWDATAIMRLPCFEQESQKIARFDDRSRVAVQKQLH